MDLIKALNEKQLKEVPQVLVGDTVRVHVKVKEGARERIQVFEGTVIAKNHGGIEGDHHRPPPVLRRRRGEGVPRPLSVHREDRDGASRLCPPRQAVLPA